MDTRELDASEIHFNRNSRANESLFLRMRAEIERLTQRVKELEPSANLKIGKVDKG